MKHTDVLKYLLTLDVVENVIVPALLLTGGIVLLQANAIPYWQVKSGDVLGVVWSILLEGIGLWLLYQPEQIYRAAGLLTSVVLVGVPLWHILQPVAADWDKLIHAERAAATASTAEARAHLDTQLARLDESVAGYRNQLLTITHALAEPGTAPEQQRRLASARIAVQARLAAAEQARNAKDGERSRAAPQAAGLITTVDRIRAISDVAPSALSLVLFVSVDILCIRRISRFRHRSGAAAPLSTPPPPDPPHAAHAASAEGPALTPTRWSLAAAMRAAQAAALSPFRRPPPGPPPEAQRRGVADTVRTATAVLVPDTRRTGVDEMTVRRLQREIKARIEASGLSAAKWSVRENVNPRDLSFLARHFERLANGEELISVPKLAALAARYLTPTERQGSGA